MVREITELPHSSPEEIARGCAAIHDLLRDPRFTRHRFPFNKTHIPKNGIYVLFEEGEYGHGGDRIVRVGTHTGDNQLLSRLAQHFLKPKKDRSIFRKNIGRCLLNQASDPYLKVWEIDFTTRAKREEFGHLRNEAYEAEIEEKVSANIRKAFSFVVFGVPGKDERLYWEERLIATVAGCLDCKASDFWLGQQSPVEKIRQSGLWVVQGLSGRALTQNECSEMQHLL